MNKVLAGCVVGVGLLGAATANPVALTCVNCNSEQECINNPPPWMFQADHCDIFWYEGQWWCNFHGECQGEENLDALAMTPAGTYLGIGTARSEDGTALVTACRKLIVVHLPNDGRNGPLTLRI